LARTKEDSKTALSHHDLAGEIQRHSTNRPEFRPQWAATITLHIIGAGFDTLGMTLSSCLIWVSKTPGCQAKLYAELETAGISSKMESIPKYDQTLSLPYLTACITEAMRLTPVIGISLPRIVPKEGAIIDGHHLSPGDVVGMNPWIVHRDHGLYGDDAEEYKPERYRDASENQRHVMEAMSLAFGGPSRSCPGQHLAWLALRKTLATVFSQFEIEILDDQEAKKYGGGWREDCFFVVKWYGVWMRLKTRD